MTGTEINLWTPLDVRHNQIVGLCFILYSMIKKKMKKNLGTLIVTSVMVKVILVKNGMWFVLLEGQLHSKNRFTRIKEHRYMSA